MIKIILAEDQILIQHALKALIKQSGEVEILATVNNAHELFKQLDLLRPDVILLDFQYAKLTGLEVIKILDEKMPWVKVVSLAFNNHSFQIKEMLKYGAKGFLSKNCSVQELYDGIRNVYEGKTFFCSHCSKVLLRDIAKAKDEDEVTFSLLTPREIEIISFLSDGYTTNNISTKLFISSKTVERHKTNILKKLNVKNTAQLVKVATLNGLIFS